MATYTTQVRSICEFYADAEHESDNHSLNNIITAALPKIFDFAYPIFDDAYKEELERKIIRHYLMHEIGLETVGLWKFYLETRLNEIMPYYNELYKTAVTDFNPSYEFDYSKTGDKENSGTEQSTSNDTITNNGSVTDSGTDVHSGGYSDTNVTTGSIKREESPTGTYKDVETNNITETDGTTRKEYFSDTPQGGVSGVDNETYLTTYRKNVPSGANTKTGTVSTERSFTNYKDTNTETYNNLDTTGGRTYNNDTVESDNTRTIADNTTKAGTKNVTTGNNGTYTERVYGIGNIANYAKGLLEFRKAILDIDTMIINDLADLFMNIY